MPVANGKSESESESDSESTDKTKRRAELRASVHVYGTSVHFFPNVHAILSLSALIVVVVLIYSKMLTHGEATPLLMAEIAHFCGWIYLELPEALLIE
jgi:hypothetical protein